MSGSFSAYLRRLSLALGRATKIVDNDAGTTRTEEQSVDLAEAAASSGDNDDLAVVSQLLGHDDVNVCM